MPALAMLLKLDGALTLGENTADLGGDIYALLPDRNHIGPILQSLLRFVATL